MVGNDAFLAVRAERVQLLPDGASPAPTANVVACRPRLRVYKGNYYDIELETNLGIVISRLWEPDQPAEGSYAIWRAEDCVIGPLDSESGHNAHQR